MTPLRIPRKPKQGGKVSGHGDIQTIHVERANGDFLIKSKQESIVAKEGYVIKLDEPTDIFEIIDLSNTFNDIILNVGKGDISVPPTINGTIETTPKMAGGRVMDTVGLTGEKTQLFTRDNTRTSITIVNRTGATITLGDVDIDGRGFELENGEIYTDEQSANLPLYVKGSGKLGIISTYTENQEKQGYSSIAYEGDTLLYLGTKIEYKEE